MSLLTFLLSKTRELTLKVMLHRSESEQKLFNEMQEVTEKSLKDKVEEQKSLIKKQEEIQFWAGIGLKNIRRIINACCRCFFYFYRWLFNGINRSRNNLICC